ncbi:MAG: asparagine synthase (glutamine-hydrolyzing) [Flavobacteriales bacterium]|nr:asparagine synthase (glutamine-hydrolyzing) [Flavobacteriales bacterium]
MCGIAGAIDLQGALAFTGDLLQRFADPLRFRGPDASGECSEQFDGVAVQMAHRRLSIIDLSPLGNQPMYGPGQRSVIVFNGEIYNYRALKQELQAQGARFRTNSDTEVLLIGAEIWGMDTLLERIDGMFAFALYDRDARELVLARDRFGKKPLYYAHRGPRLWFSSDIRSFDVVPEIPKRIDLFSLGYFFGELTTPDPHTIWQDIRKVPPATCLRLSNHGEVRLSRYWHLSAANTCKLGPAEIVERADELLTAAVAKRLVADVNVAAQLSGGLDSSLVTAKMAMLGSKPIATYSVGFEDPRFNELPFARQVAERYDTDHQEILLKAKDMENADALILEYGEPFADVSMIPSYLIAKKISTTEKVVCGGDGGDELFAGYYGHYFASKMDQVRGLAWSAPLVEVLQRIAPIYQVKFLAELLRAARGPAHALLDRHMGFSTADLGYLFQGNGEAMNAVQTHHARVWAAHEATSSSTLKHLLRASMDTRLVNDYIVKVDRATMYASLEMRSPFLDRHLAEFACSLNDTQLFKPFGTKSVLKAVAVKYLPEGLIHRNKMGFAVPIGSWFRKELKDRFLDVVLAQRQDLVPLNYDFIAKLFERHCAGEDHANRLWALYVFHLWARSRAN